MSNADYNRFNIEKNGKDGVILQIYFDVGHTDLVLTDEDYQNLKGTINDYDFVNEENKKHSNN